MSTKNLSFFSSQRQRESQLAYNCKNYADTFNCNESSTSFCIRGQQKCDGIANCPNGEDESLSLCSAMYSSLATIECKKDNIYNVNVMIKAVPCNGIIECGDGKDESSCSMPDFIEIAIFLAIVAITFAATIVMKRRTVKNLQTLDRNQTLTKEDFMTMHGTEELKTKMLQIQSCESSKKTNQQFALWEIDQHSGNTNETVLCIKVKSALLKSNFQSK